MKTALVLLLSCAGLSLAQTEANPADTPAPVLIKRLAQVTWDLDTHKLVWVVQKGSEVNGEFVVASTDKYEVSPEEASMMSKDEKRGLGEEEAGSVTDLVNLLSLYCAESTDWWESGSEAQDSSAARQSAPQKPGKTPDKSDTKKTVPPSEKPTRVGEPDQKPPVRLPGMLVADNSPLGK